MIVATKYRGLSCNRRGEIHNRVVLGAHLDS